MTGHRHPERLEPLATRPEVAAFLGIAPKTMAQWASKGIGPRYVRIEGAARYRWADVHDWIAAQPSGGGGAV